MTLRRQLTFIIAALFVLLFMGSFAINVHNTRAYLNDQLNSISRGMGRHLPGPDAVALHGRRRHGRCRKSR